MMRNKLRNQSETEAQQELSFDFLDPEKPDTNAPSVAKIHQLSKFKEKKEKQRRKEIYLKIIAMAPNLDD